MNYFPSYLKQYCYLQIGCDNLHVRMCSLLDWNNHHVQMRRNQLLTYCYLNNRLRCLSICSICGILNPRHSLSRKTSMIGQFKYGTFIKESGLKDFLPSDWLRRVLPLPVRVQCFPPLPVIQDSISSTTAVASTTRTKQDGWSFWY